MDNWEFNARAMQILREGGWDEMASQDNEMTRIANIMESLATPLNEDEEEMNIQDGYLHRIGADND